jgi:mRNA interferase HicA
MKRRELLRHLQQHVCSLLREGSRHSWWINAVKKRRSAILRHTEIHEYLARKSAKIWKCRTRDSQMAQRALRVTHDNVPPFLAGWSAVRRSLRLPALVVRYLRSASIARGLPGEQYRSCADTRPSARSDRSNELRQKWPEKGAWSACHSSK